MRILQFICWLRGFHACNFFVEATQGVQLYGTGMPCNVCGRYPIAGKTKFGTVVFRYPYKPEHFIENMEN